MKKSKLNSVSTLGVACGLLLVSGGAMAQVAVPFADSAPLACTTANFSIVANAEGGFPKFVPCDSDPEVGCSDYSYTITSRTGARIDHTLFAVSADQELHHTDPNSFVPSVPGAGDTTTGFLAYAMHEYPIRFNSNSTTYNAEIFVKGRSAPRISTVLIKSGKTTESCLIAGPGVAGDPFQPVTQTEATVVAGGKCPVIKHFDANGNLFDITLDANAPENCIVGKPPEITVLGEKLQNNTSRNGITFGSNTSTCYGPPVPRTPICVCTAAPCPW